MSVSRVQEARALADFPADLRFVRYHGWLMKATIPWPRTTQRGLRPQPKVAITLRCDEHLLIDIHEPKQGSLIRQVGEGLRSIVAGSSLMWPCFRLVTAERDGYKSNCPSPRLNCPECESAERCRLRVRGTTSIQGLLNSGGLR